MLVHSGYEEEWWGQLLIGKLAAPQSASPVSSISISSERLQTLATNPLSTRPNAKEATEVSTKLGIPLHPSYTFFWDLIKPEELEYLRERIREFSKPSEETILIPNDTKIKSLLEKLCLPHRVEGTSLRILEAETVILRALFKPEAQELLYVGSTTLERLSLLAA